MNTKLTLTIEDTVIEKAKKYAQNRKQSLSYLIENYLKALTAEAKGEEPSELTPIVKSLKGSFQAPADFDYTKELSEELSKKYI